MKNLNRCLALAVLVVISGCGGGTAEDRPAVAPVSGTVMYNGSPVVGATVSFWAEGAPRAASGVTDSAGKFQLSMFEANDGAIPGENKITVTKVVGATAPAVDPTAAMDDPTSLANAVRPEESLNADDDADGPTQAIPAIYASETTTPLKETVKADGDNTFVLQLAD
jgi:hypothetical protein